MEGQQGGGTPAHYSPDGKWWWDGQKWVAVRQAHDLTSATAATTTRLPHQRRSFWIGIGVVTLVLVGLGAWMAAVANSSGVRPGAHVGSVASAPTAALPSTSTPGTSPSATPRPTPTPTATPTAVPAAVAAPATAAPAQPTSAPLACYPLSNSGTCYEPGEFCRTSDHGRTGRAGNGEPIVCEYNNGWRWEPA